MATKITMERYQEAREGYEGWCKTCQDFTTGEVEPDAEDYECEQCREHTVIGAEDALVLGVIEVV